MICKLSELPSIILSLSNQLEDNANTIQFDISEWVEAYPIGKISIEFMRPGDSAVYPVMDEKLSLDENILTWTVDENVTAVSGYGAIVLICKQGDVTVRTPRISTLVMAGLPAAGPPPDPVQNWINKANDALEIIEGIHFEINDNGELEVNING